MNSKFQFFGVMNFKNCVYISWKIQILTILRHKITQIFTKKYYLLSKFSKLHNLETHFCELLRPRAPPFQKIKWNPWNLVTTLQKSCFLGPTIFKFPQPNWRYYAYFTGFLSQFHSFVIDLQFKVFKIVNRLALKNAIYCHLKSHFLLQSWKHEKS